jgi:hypothetical protein
MSFSEHFERRRSQRLSSRRNTWTGFVKLVLLLIAVLMVIQFLGSGKGARLSEYVLGKHQTEQSVQERP